MDTKMKISENDLPQTFVVKLLGRKWAKGIWGIKNTRQPIDEMVMDAKSQNLTLPIVSLRVSPEGILISHLPQIKLTKMSTDQNANEIRETSMPKSCKKSKSLLTAIQKHIFSSKYKESKKKEFFEKENCSPQQLWTNFQLLEKMKNDLKLRADESFFGIDVISYGVQDLVYTRIFSIIVVSEEERSRFHCYAFICQDRNMARNMTYSLAAAFQVYSRSLKARNPPICETPVKPSQPKILSIDLSVTEKPESEA